MWTAYTVKYSIFIFQSSKCGGPEHFDRKEVVKQSRTLQLLETVHVMGAGMSIVIYIWLMLNVH